MKIIVTIIPTDLVTNSLLSIFFVLFYKPTTKIRFSTSWWYGNEKYFCILFITSRALLQSHAEFNRLLSRNFLTCYFCSYYSSNILVDQCLLIELHYGFQNWQCKSRLQYVNLAIFFFSVFPAVQILRSFSLCPAAFHLKEKFFYSLKLSK